MTRKPFKPAHADSLTADEARIIVAFLKLDALVHASRVNMLFRDAALDHIRNHILPVLRAVRDGSFRVQPEDARDLREKLGVADLKALVDGITSGSLASLNTRFVCSPHTDNAGLEATCDARGVELLHLP